jgi:hypothetical protein
VLLVRANSRVETGILQSVFRTPGKFVARATGVAGAESERRRQCNVNPIKRSG